MNESELFICKHCGNEHEALTQEIASFRCPNLPKLKPNGKVLDKVIRECLTELNSSSETQEPKRNRNGEPDNGKEK